MRDRQHDHEMRFLRERTPLDRMHSRPGIEAAGVVLGVFGSIIHTNVLSFNGKPQTQVKQAGLACAVAVHCAKSGGDMKVGEVVDLSDGKDSIT